MGARGGIKGGGVAIVALLMAFVQTRCLDVMEPCGAGKPGESKECPVTGWFDRAFEYTLPASWDGKSALPLIVSFHGGGGNRTTGENSTCPDGEAGGPQCLHAVAANAGYMVVSPDGTGQRPSRNLRTWNAGGGVDGYICVSGGACEAGVDDMAFFDSLLADIEKVVPIDRKRIYLTGLSNGGSISHRLACQRPELIAAIAPVGGGNQFEVTGGVCKNQVPVMHIHGTADPCWRYDGSEKTCSVLKEGKRASVDYTIEQWRKRNGCTEKYDDETLADTGDKTTVIRRAWQDCEQPTVLIKIEGGGHTWPNGHQYFGEDVVGVVSHDFDANHELVKFFDANHK